MSNLFDVSVDSLLKENPDAHPTIQGGYYVSQETADGFLAFHRKTTLRTATGAAILWLAGIPYFLFSENTILSITLTAIVLMVGLAFILSMAMMGNPYRKIKSERLLFDPATYSTLITARDAQKKKTLVLVLLAIAFVLVAGILSLFDWSAFPLEEIQCILAACATYLLILAIGIQDTYDVLVNSDTRMDSFWGRLQKKLKK